MNSMRIAISLSLVATAAGAAAPGITGPAFNLTATDAFISQPDGQSVYSWGYGCNGTPSGFAPTPGGVNLANANCTSMQIPGPTLIVTEGQPVTVTLTNNLPAAAGNTSILFPGFTVSATGGVAGLLTKEAPHNGSVTYSFTATTPGTRAYYSGTQGDLQIEMGLFGAIIVLPARTAIPANCTSGLAQQNLTAEAYWGERDFRLAAAAYDHPRACYDREYLFQFSEMDANIHAQALAQVTARKGCVAGSAPCSLNVPTEPYHPAYFMINGRSMPDDMDPNYAGQYPHQPYNGNPHMHPGEQVLLRIIGQGRWQHPFHEHGNHVRVLARDGNPILTPDGAALAGPLLFTTTTTPGLAMDGIFYWTGRGLNWDAYGHRPTPPNTVETDPDAALPCTPDANGYNTGAPTAINYYEWCQDHNKPLEAKPFGDVGVGGPATLPDANLFTNGAWYGGSPYLGPDATIRAVGPTGTTPPSGTIANSPTGEAGFAFMWHSHNEREITTNNIFPGGMLMMMLVDSREFVIDESN
ncbi:MAG TPA: multicopper oxidase family protein [Amycolatopsis sp.]|nr:multicopper oxidase family protein [Amycolatopsis sp.]